MGEPNKIFEQLKNVEKFINILARSTKLKDIETNKTVIMKLKLNVDGISIFKTPNTQGSLILCQVNENAVFLVVI